MKPLLVIGIVLLVVGLVLVFGLFPYIDSQASQQITSELNSHITSKSLDANSSIEIPYNASKAIFVLYYNSSKSPLEVLGAPPNSSSTSNSGVYYIIPNGSGEIVLRNNWSEPVNVQYSYIYYTLKYGDLIGILILMGIPLLIIGAFVTIFGFLRRKK
ncbi:MAG: hypothetical protein QXR57_06040 [Metallosphaera sp.]|uniref:Uncharacterized protein n=1 Tax=Metallosphaera cuprina (strain Ar-4) TaxID=1006006 RepID=F4G006_METCR|nr:hypothetical protein [Metallosphaera cuprina]AEB95768.1 conserved hypothetical protein [Metallosphaera cuprina Ar-4]